MYQEIPEDYDNFDADMRYYFRNERNKIIKMHQNIDKMDMEEANKALRERQLV